MLCVLISFECLSGIDAVEPLTEELRRRGEEEDPSAGKSALGLIVDVGEDYASGVQISARLGRVGGLELTADIGEDTDWQEYEECVKAAVRLTYHFG